MTLDIVERIEDFLKKSTHPQTSSMPPHPPTNHSEPIQIEPNHATLNISTEKETSRGTRHRALFIGINYPGTHATLRGCVNDVKMMMILVHHLGFPLDDIRILVDTNDIPDHYTKPTKANIIEGMKWLVEGAQDGDTLFLHFSGHGTQVKDTSADEEDGMDEALVPCDFVHSGYILDDEIVRLIVAPLPAGVRLTALLDCCHSGTLMDLPYTWVASENNTAQAATRSLKMSLHKQWSEPKFVTEMLSGTYEPDSPKMRGFTVLGDGAIPADVVMFSGCRDEQTSADVGNTKRFNIPAEAGPGEAGGACTSALTEVLMKHSKITFIDLLEKMRVNLKKRRFTQIPQLSSSKPVDLKVPFSLFGKISTAPATLK